MAIVDKYPGAQPVREITGYCFNCLQPVRGQSDDALVHVDTSESQCKLYATLKNEENQ